MNSIFYGLLVLIAWVPLPLGSNRAWAWTIMVIACCLIAMAWLLGYLLGRLKITEAFRRARWALSAGVLWLGYIGLQFAPLPADWVLLLSPRAYEAHALVAATSGQPLAARLTISIDPHATRDFWFKTLAYGCTFALTLLLVDTRHRLELLLKTLVISGTLQALYASLMVLSGLEYSFLIQKAIGQGLATGTFVNRNHLAGYLNLCLAAGIGLMIAKLGGADIHTWRQRLRSIVHLLLGEKTRLRIYLIVMVIGLVLTRSRMGNAAFFASTLIVGSLGLIMMRNAPRTTMLFLASLIALDVLIVGTWFGVDQVAKRIQQTEITTNADNVLPTEDRDEVDRLAMRYAKDYWLTGSGGGSFYVAFPGYSDQGLIGYFDFAHNDYVQVLAETGVIGLTLCALIVAMAAAQALLALRRRNDPLMRGTAFGITLAICWLAIHSAVDFNMQIPANAFTMTLMLSLAWVAATLPGGAETANGLRKRRRPSAGSREGSSGPTAHSG
jgi:putative inorganic carbon (hco3(-)) transporter